MTPQEQVDAIQEKNTTYVDKQYERYNELIEELRQYDIEMSQPEQLSNQLLTRLEQEFKTTILLRLHL